MIWASVFDTEPPGTFWYRGNAWFVPYAPVFIMLGLDPSILFGGR